VRVQRQRYRDQIWYLLIDSATGRQHRINDTAYQFIGRCNGERSVQQVWDSLLEQLGDNAPTQDEVVQVLTQLAQSELLQCEVTPDVEALFRQGTERRRRRRSAWLNPMAFRVPLYDPSRLLDRLRPCTKALFHRYAFALWLAFMLVSGLTAFSHWTALQSHAITALHTPRYLLLAWLCFPVIKTLHELGHALAVRHWGGQVHQAGITFLLLTPAPYVDASAATAFRHQRQRVIVSAAGILVELTLAAAALFVWLNVQPGTVRDVAFVTLFIGAVSTVLFNANPLVRFDGYYMLCDALDTPNLAMRSRAWWCALLQRRLIGVDHDGALLPAAGERKWLLLYAPASWLYRVLISITIVQWIGQISSLLGWLIGLTLLVAVVIKPVWSLMRDLLNAASRSPFARRARVTVFAVSCGLILLLFVVPLPLVTVAQGVVWLPEQSRVRVGTDGFVVRVLAQDGSRVERGQVLLELSDPELSVAREKLDSRLAGLYAEQYQAMLLDPVQAQDAAESIDRTRAELKRIDERIAQLQLRSQVAGRLVMPHQSDLTGRFVRQGAQLGYVLTSNDISVRAAVAEQDASLVRNDTRRIEVRFAEDLDKQVSARLTRDLPAATDLLPSAALSDRFGGAYVTDPEDKEALRTLQPITLIDITVPGKPLDRAGGRVWVRFDHGAQPLAAQWYRRLSQLLLQHFNPSD
jgi:putative peptide zinc metalloprotease protein